MRKDRKETFFIFFKMRNVKSKRYKFIIFFNFYKTLKKKMEDSGSLFNSDFLSDGILRIFFESGEEIFLKIHKAILSQNSDYFKILFKFSDNKNEIIHFNLVLDEKHKIKLGFIEDMIKIIKWMYQLGKIPSKNIESISIFDLNYQILRYLQVPYLNEIRFDDIFEDLMFYFTPINERGEHITTFYGIGLNLHESCSIPSDEEKKVAIYIGESYGSQFIVRFNLKNSPDFIETRFKQLLDYLISKDSDYYEKLNYYAYSVIDIKVYEIVNTLARSLMKYLMKLNRFDNSAEEKLRSHPINMFNYFITK